MNLRLVWPFAGAVALFISVPAAALELSTITVTLDAPPPTRVVCVFSSSAHAIKPTIEFAPRAAEELTQSLVLDGPASAWSFRCAADPFRVQVVSATKEAVEVDVHFSPKPSTEERPTEITLIPKIPLSGAGLPSAPTFDREILLKFKVAGSSGPAAAQLGPSVAFGPSGRSFEGLGEVAAELLQIIAEIAVERAKASAFELVRQSLKDAACGDTLKDKLPETCATVKALRMQDLTTTVASLRDALLRDLAREVVAQLRSSVPTDDAALVELLGRTAVEAVMRGMIEIEPADMLRAIEAGWRGQPDGTPRKTIATAATVIRICSQAGYSCTSSQTMQLVEAAVGGTATMGQTHWDAVRALIAATRPRPDDEARTKIGGLIDAGFVVFRAVNDCIDAAGESGACLLAAEVRSFVGSLLRDDVTGAVVAGTRVLAIAIDAAHRDDLYKITRVVGTVAAYAATFQKKPTTDEERKALYQARKELIVDLVDSMTVRAERGGDIVVSLGVMPGFFVGGQHRFGKTDGLERAVPQLSVPLGFAVQGLPTATRAVGWHVGTSVLDLGQFVALDGSEKLSDPSWATVFSPGLQGGWLFGVPSSVIFMGGDVRVAPGLFTGDGDPTDGSTGAFRLGGSVAYYVPLTDFN